MRFYVTTSLHGETIDCALTLREAKAVAEGVLGGAGYQIDAVEVDVSAETIRRLLGNLGGYAQSTRKAARREEVL